MTNIAEFGASSWELDALEPAVLLSLVRGAVLSLREDGKWEAATDTEQEHRERLAEVAAGMGRGGA